MDKRLVTCSPGPHALVVLPLRGSWSRPLRRSGILLGKGPANRQFGFNSLLCLLGHVRIPAGLRRGAGRSSFRVSDRSDHARGRWAILGFGVIFVSGSFHGTPPL